MQLRRREFVAALSAGVLVHGLGRIGLAGDEPAKPPEAPPTWFKDALAEMKASGAPGVAIVLPESTEAREKLRAELEALVKDAQLLAQIHLLEAVYVVVPGRFVGAKDGETAALLDAEGKRLAGAAVAFTPGNFADGIRPLLRGGERFAARVKAARTPAFEKALKELESPEPNENEKTVEGLVANFAAVGAAVIDARERETPGSHVQMRLTWVITRTFARRRDGDGTASEKPLPFGARWKKDAVPLPEVDPCPPCGMMARSARSRDTMELLVRDAASPK